MAVSLANEQAGHLQATDLQVIVTVRDGDVDAFEVLVDRHYASLTRHLIYRLGDREVAAELVQDTFLDAYRHLDRFDGNVPFAAWLFGIAHKRCLMHWRRKRLRSVMSLDWLPGAVAGAMPQLRQADASDAWIEGDRLRPVFEKLTPPLREALLLHSLDGFTAQEVAQILGISATAAARRISRAKEAFRRAYRELCEDERTLR